MLNHIHAFVEGRTSFLEGKSLEDNPYREGTFLSQQWILGWNQGLVIKEGD